MIAEQEQAIATTPDESGKRIIGRQHVASLLKDPRMRAAPRALLGAACALADAGMLDEALTILRVCIDILADLRFKFESGKIGAPRRTPTDFLVRLRCLGKLDRSIFRLAEKALNGEKVHRHEMPMLVQVCRVLWEPMEALDVDAEKPDRDYVDARRCYGVARH